jgi:acetyltransferase
MAIHPYPVELEATVTLQDGSRLRVRPIRPEDAAAEVAFVAGLSDESRYLRFMYHLHELTPRMLARFTQVDYDRELALIALAGKPGDEKIVGVARYVANPDRESAEFAVVVADAWQGRGLGRALMGKLIASAKRRGFHRLIGSILGINASMQKLVRALGFRLRADLDDPEQLIAELELSGKRRRSNPD